MDATGNVCAVADAMGHSRFKTLRDGMSIPYCEKVTEAIEKRNQQTVQCGWRRGVSVLGIACLPGEIAALCWAGVPGKCGRYVTARSCGFLGRSTMEPVP